MAQVKFYRGTGTPKTTDGAISINTSNGRMYLGNGSSAKELGTNPSFIQAGDNDETTQLSSNSLDFYDATDNSILSLSRVAGESCKLAFDNAPDNNYIRVEDSGEAYFSFNNSSLGVDLTTYTEGALTTKDDAGYAKLFCEGSKSSVYLYRNGPYSAELTATNTDQSVYLYSTVGGNVKLNVPQYSSSNKGFTGGLSVNSTGASIKFGVCTYKMTVVGTQLTSGTTTTVTYAVPGLVMSASTPTYASSVLSSLSVTYGSPTIKSIGVSNGKIVTNISFTMKPSQTVSAATTVYTNIQFCGIYY